MLTAVRDGDRQALGVYAVRMLPGLFDALKGHLTIRGRTDWAEDICQEVILKVEAEIIRGSGPDGTAVPDLRAGWLFRAGKNIAVDWQRRERRKSELKKAHNDRLDVQLERQRERRLVREQVEALLSRLAVEYSDLLRLIYVDGLTTREAASELRITVSAAYKREQRGLAQLRRLSVTDPKLVERIIGPAGRS